MKFCTAILLSFLASTTYAQKSFDIATLSEEAKAILVKIEQDESVPSDTMGIRAGYLPKDYPLTVLRKKLGVDELIQLTDHANPVVRCYAFKALTMTNEKASFDVIKDHLQDTVRISTYHGCLSSYEFVGDFFVGAFDGREAISHDSVHLNVLDSLLIFTPNKLQSRIYAIKSAAGKGKYYNRVREIAINDKLWGAVVALAMFKKAEDVDIIMETKVTGEEPFVSHSLAVTFFAICQFPHPKCLPFLERHLQSMMEETPDLECRYLYRALSNYNNEKARALLSQPLQIANRELRMKHLDELSHVLEKNPHPVYNSLRKRLKTEMGSD